MFHGSVVWRGFVYAILMMLGKLCTGLWLVRFSPQVRLAVFVRVVKSPLSYATSCIRRRPTNASREKSRHRGAEDGQGQETSSAVQPAQSSEAPTSVTERDITTNSEISEPSSPPGEVHSSTPLPPKPKSLYPASILSLAMVARGEIGYLIASLAESNRIFGETSSGYSSDTYLIVVWAISLCTLIGPISVGTLVKRIKSLQQKRTASGGPDPLGVWGI